MPRRAGPRSALAGSTLTEGDETQPKVRSRLVAPEIKRDNNYELFVATPPIEYVKYLVSRAASSQFTNHPTCVMVQGVKKGIVLRSFYETSVC